MMTSPTKCTKNTHTKIILNLKEDSKESPIKSFESKESAIKPFESKESPIKSFESKESTSTEAMPLDHTRYDTKFDPLLLVGKESSAIEIRVTDGEKTWQRFFASAFVLSQKSEVFRAMLEMDCKESSKKAIEVHDFSPRTVYQFLRFLNGTKLSVSTTEDMIALLKMADKYLVEDLKQTCQDILESRIELHNVLKMYESVRLHNAPTLTNKCEIFIAAFFPALSRFDDFLFLDSDTVKQVICLDTLNITTEMKIYDAVCRWSRQRCAEKELCICEKHLIQEGKKLFKHVRFGNMTEDEKKSTFSSILDEGEVASVKPRQKLSSEVLFQLTNKLKFTPTGLDLSNAQHLSISVTPNTYNCLMLMPKDASIYLVGFRGVTYGSSPKINIMNMCLSKNDAVVKCSPTSLLECEKKTVGSAEYHSYILDQPLKLEKKCFYTVRATFSTSSGVSANTPAPAIPYTKDKSVYSVKDMEYLYIYGNVYHIYEILYIAVNHL